MIARRDPVTDRVPAADALLAEWAKDHRRAAAAWQRAAGLAADGAFLIVEQARRADAARALGDHEQVLAACDEVVRPRRFSWAWGGAVGPCLRMSAEAAEQLGRLDEARASWQRLLALRSQGSKSDQLLRAAREGVARTSAGAR